jgi:hypothetical protein
VESLIKARRTKERHKTGEPTGRSAREWAFMAALERHAEEDAEEDADLY